MSTASRLALELVIQARDTASAALARLRAGMEGISSLGSRFGQGLAGAFSGIEAKIFAVTSALGALGVSLGLGSAVEAASKFEQLKLQLTGLDGSAKAADAAIAAIQKSFKPSQVQSVTEAYVQLRTFGLQPSVEDLRSLIDFNARTGKGMENLQGIIAQVGQAWSKEKLQYEDVLVLLERGVPVWNLLTQATGKSTIELQEMASKGELSREYIAKLVAEMGKASQGASDLASSGWQGLKDQFSSLVELFQRNLVEGGVFQALKTKLSEVNDVLTYAINSGLAKQWGEQLGASLTNAGTYVVGFMRSLSGAFGALQIFFNAFSAGIAAIVGAVSIGLAKLVDGLARPIGLVRRRHPEGGSGSHGGWFSWRIRTRCRPNTERQRRHGSRLGVDAIRLFGNLLLHRDQLPSPGLRVTKSQGRRVRADQRPIPQSRK